MWSAVWLSAGGALVVLSPGQEGRPARRAPSGPAAPLSGPADTLTPEGGRSRVTLAGGEPVLLAETAPAAGEAGRPATGPVETFLQAEARTGESDARFLLPVPAPAISRTPASAPAPSAVASVATAAASLAVPGIEVPEVRQRTPEELIEQIEVLRSSFHETPGPEPTRAEPLPGAPVESGPADAPDPVPGGPSRASADGGFSQGGSGREPYAFAQPVRNRPSIGQQVATRSVGAGEVGATGSHAAAGGAAAPGDGAAEPVPTAPFVEIAAAAPAPSSPERKGLLGRLFAKKPSREERAAQLAASANRSSLEQFPLPDAPRTRPSKDEDEAQEIIDRIYQEYIARVGKVTAEDLVANGHKGLPAVPADFDAVWIDRVKGNFWKGEEPLAVRLEEVYARALANSNQVKVFGYDPLIRESAIQESEGMFDLEMFTKGSYGHTDDPTSTLLETGEVGRFLENRGEGEAGLRRRFATGGQISLSNRFMTLDNNSEFLEPNPQTSSSLVLSVVQPLLKGGGYHYNKARLKVAKIDAGMAASEYIGRLEKHLLEVNRAYWEVYFARAAFLIRRSLVAQTTDIVETLEARADEATASELLRARSELSRRRTGLNRSEMAVRNAEERLRSLVNDPEFPIGGPGEFVPVTAPILAPPKETVHSAAMEAVDNRPEIAHSFGQLRMAAIRHQAGKHEKLPQLDLMAESRLAGLDGNRRVAGAYDNMLAQDASWMVGFQFSQPFENNSAKARQERLQYEMFQQTDSIRSTMDTILLESVVSFRELMTVYRDLQGNFQQVLSTREELRGLRERLDVDSDNEQTVAYRLQNVMDALERNQIAEEQFLYSVVAYNVAFASLERAKGTFLKVQDVAIERAPSPESKRLETLRAVPAGSLAPVAADRGGDTAVPPRP